MATSDVKIFQENASADLEIRSFAPGANQVMAFDSNKLPITKALAIADVANLQGTLDGKQATLVNQTNIKSINGVSLLGGGDLVVGGGSVECVTSVTYETAENTTTEKKLCEFVIPANTLNVGDFYDIEVLETFKNGSGSAQNCSVKSYWNGSLQSTGTISASNYNVDAHRMIHFYLIVLSSTQAIFYSYNNYGGGRGLWMEGFHDSASTSATSWTSGNNNKLITIDRTIENTFKLTHYFANANANLYRRVQKVNARKYKI